MERTHFFLTEEDKKAFEEFLAKWSEDTSGVKKAFGELKKMLLVNMGTVLSFHPRPGVSYSLRASVNGTEPDGRPYYAVLDVVEEPEGARWLSVCFYADSVSDPGALGNLIPRGLLGEDGYCFDVECYNEHTISYINQRINEAYSAYVSGQEP